MLLVSVMAVFYFAHCAFSLPVVDNALYIPRNKTCGLQLSDLLALICKDKYNSPGGAGSDGAGGIVDECCKSTCSPFKMIQYCEDPEAARIWWEDHYSDKRNEIVRNPSSKQTRYQTERPTTEQTPDTMNEIRRPGGQGTKPGKIGHGEKKVRKRRGPVTMLCTYKSFGHYLMAESPRRKRRGKVPVHSQVLVKQVQLNKHLGRPPTQVIPTNGNCCGNKH